MSNLGPKILLTLGAVSLAHSAYSAASHRQFLRLTEQEFAGLPTDIVFQCLCSFVLCCYAVVRLSGHFKPIEASAELAQKTWESVSTRPSFHTFNHRGGALFGFRRPAVGTVNAAASGQSSAGPAAPVRPVGKSALDG